MHYNTTKNQHNFKRFKLDVLSTITKITYNRCVTKKTLWWCNLIFQFLYKFKYPWNSTDFIWHFSYKMGGRRILRKMNAYELARRDARIRLIEIQWNNKPTRGLQGAYKRLHKTATSRFQIYFGLQMMLAMKVSANRHQRYYFCYENKRN